ncbi:unnamed protein product [Dracunculus medinensis]|uniref:PH domain-containing protein n=1 Tax=Dracunculus medinensis TaxID=318479 RepID=A0A3P7SZX8_DRAME|nr:unnamed protein product [Dracunculus medinensis]
MLSILLNQIWNYSSRAIVKQKREYKDEKKRVAQELVTSLRDQTIIVMADWLKIRGTLRKWNRFFCVLKPGLMLIYKNDKTDKAGYWVGTVLLNTCELIERPSKKDGFCFKLFHPLDQNIWATRGPLGESYGAVTLQPLPTTHLICRAPSVQAGGCWMDALQLTLRCSGLLLRTMHKVIYETPMKDAFNAFNDESLLECSQKTEISEIEAEKHFNGTILFYLYSLFSHFYYGPLLSNTQTEDLADENKSLIWSLLKQVRPGMDLSRVTLPTFILEPRSFLEKLSDFYYHSDLLADAAVEDNPLERIKKVVKFYMSGFYKKPKGLKKPYNPILGEIFRCKWEHPDGSASYYIAEQVAGYNICGTILAKSKYYGNSLSALMIGTIRITLLNRGETYTATLPYANCKGIMIGTLSMEYGGQVNISCNRTAYTCTMDFKLKPFLGGSMNVVTGAIHLGREPLVKIDGTWDSDIYIYENGKKAILWSPTKETVKQRLPRYEIPLEKQGEWESKKLWLKVSEAIANEDQKAATREKTALEDDQRARAKNTVYHKPKYFKYEPLTKTYEYIYADYRPWDNNNDVRQMENNFMIRTLSKYGPINGANAPAVESINANSGIERDQSDSDSNTIDRTLEILLRIEDKLENGNRSVTYIQLLTAFAVFAIVQLIVLPLFMQSKI